MSTDGGTGGAPAADDADEASGGSGGSGERGRTAGGGEVTEIHIGSMSGGSFASGSHGTAESTNVTVVGQDPRQQQLLAAVRELRAALPQGERTAADDGLDAELAEVEGEITRSGRADRGRLARMLGSLAAYGPAAATAASVTAVIQAVAQILG